VKEPNEPRLPNFLLIGAPKSGTTSLHLYLAAHPQIFMSETKELNFFIAALNWSMGREWYMQQFAHAGAATAVGEASPRYTQHPDYRGVAERAAALLPQARLVYVVRNPIDQMLSHYRDRVRWKAERAPAERALQENPIYLETARYAFQLEQFLAHFPREQILVVISEHLRARLTRTETLTRIFTFLGVDETWESQVLTREHNVAPPAPRWLFQHLSKMPGWDPAISALPERIKRSTWPITHGKSYQPIKVPENVTRELIAKLADEIVWLRQFVGGDFDGWGIA
jgi:hypothetical protein